jgi:hypothetical protein
MKRHFWNILIAIDQFGNAATGGDPDETISSRAAKAMQKSRAWGCISLDLTDGADAVVPD